MLVKYPNLVLETVFLPNWLLTLRPVFLFGFFSFLIYSFLSPSTEFREISQTLHLEFPLKERVDPELAALLMNSGDFLVYTFLLKHGIFKQVNGKLIAKYVGKRIYYEESQKFLINGQWVNLNKARVISVRNFFKQNLRIAEGVIRI